MMHARSLGMIFTALFSTCGAMRFGTMRMLRTVALSLVP